MAVRSYVPCKHLTKSRLVVFAYGDEEVVEMERWITNISQGSKAAGTEDLRIIIT